MHSECAEAREPPQKDLVRIARGKSHTIAHPKATTEIMSSEAVKKRVDGGRKMDLSSKILLKIQNIPHSFLTQGRAAASEQVKDVGGSRKGGRKG